MRHAEVTACVDSRTTRELERHASTGDCHDRGRAAPNV
jgi:hypothetical protein